jgi:signal transduction histidine kinase/CheY-like chemotaxis protein
VGSSVRAWLDWIRASAFRRFFGASVALGVPLACGLAFAGFLTAERVIQESVLSELSARAELAAGEVELTVGAVMNGARALAQNAIVIGSLTDPGTVERNLVPLLRDFTAVAPSPVHLVVIDPSGRTVGCSLHGRQSNFLGAPWLPRVIGSGEIHVQIVTGDDGPALLYAQPVVPTAGARPVGGFVAEIALAPLLQEFQERREQMVASLHDDAHPAGPSGEATLDADFLVAERPLALGAEGGIQLRLAVPHDIAFRGLHRFGAISVAGLVGTLLVVIGGVWLLSSRLTRGIRRLSESVVDATLTDRRGVRVPSRSGDEVGALGAAFNVLLARLEEASEARLAEQVHRTEGAEHALRLAWRAMEQAAEAIEVIRADGLVVFSNGAAARLRASLGTAESRQRWEALFGRDLEWWGEAWRRLKAERTIELALRVRQHGESVPIAATLVFFELDGEEHAISTVRDQRERIRAEATERLASLGTLAAGVAHEINNPLAYVLGNLAYVKESLEGAPSAAPGDEERRALAEAIHGAERVRDVVRSLRAYSRPGEGPPVLADVAQELRNALKLVGNTLRHKARLVERLEETPPVLARSMELGQVFVNLLVNAAQAVRPGAGDEAEVVARCFTTADGRAAVEIWDNGVGIPQEVQERIFEPFFTTKGVGDGTGLGLSICHGIVNRLGGSIAFESEPGRGTRFTVLLPAARAAPRAEPPPEAQAPRGRILVIDDDAAVTRALARMLGRTAEVSIETDPEAALGRIGQAPRPDAILCDVMMPGLSGPAFFERLLAVDPGLARRVVFITGGAVTEAIARAVAASGQPCVDKPPDREALARAIASVQG